MKKRALRKVEGSVKIPKAIAAGLGRKTGAQRWREDRTLLRPEGLECWDHTVKLTTTSQTRIQMSEIPELWSQPLRYLRYCAHTKPHIVVAYVLGVGGPLAALTLTPVRRKLLYADAPQIPMSYPLPAKRNPNLTGFDD